MIASLHPANLSGHRKQILIFVSSLRVDSFSFPSSDPPSNLNDKFIFPNGSEPKLWLFSWSLGTCERASLHVSFFLWLRLYFLAHWDCRSRVLSFLPPQEKKRLDWIFTEVFANYAPQMQLQLLTIRDRNHIRSCLHTDPFPTPRFLPTVLIFSKPVFLHKT